MRSLEALSRWFDFRHHRLDNSGAKNGFRKNMLGVGQSLRQCLSSTTGFSVS